MTVPTLLVNGVNQTGHIHNKTLSLRQKTLDFTLIDPSTNPVLHNVVSVDAPDWHGRVSTIESYPMRGASGTDHRWVKVTCTNKHTPADDTAPFGISDAPNNSTTYGYKDFGYTQTLSDQSDLSTAEHRVQCTVYQTGLVPGMTVPVTNVAEGLSADDFIISEVTVEWLKSTVPEYHLEMSVEGVPPVTLGDLISGSGCDCPPFNAADCVDPGVGGLSCVARDTNTYSYTEGGTRSGIGPPYVDGSGNWGFISTDFVYFGRPGVVGSEYPLAGQHGDWGNGGTCGCVFTSGTDDFGCGSNQVRLTVIGPGTMTIHTAVHPGGTLGVCPDGIAGDIGAVAVISGTATVVASDTKPAGTVLTVTIPDDGECAHFIDVASVGFLMWGYGGANWTPLSTFEACTPDPGQPIVPESFTGDGTTDSFTLAWPYMPGSLEVYVEGVDWSDQVVEDDATTGDFSLAYPPPAATDSEPNVEVHYRYPK